ncbi:PH domain-containing protein [Deinococcus sp. PEB2-67]
MNQFPQVCLAQVQTQYPGEGKVAVILKNLGLVDGVRVAVAAPAGRARSGHFDLPQPGDWGVVLFTQDHGRSGVWLCNVPSDTWNAVPVELLQADPLVQVHRHPDGSQDVHWSNGDRETTLPDGTLMRVTHSKDGTPGNPAGRAVRSPWHVSEGDANRAGQRTPYEPPALAPADLHVQHASGATLTVTADGSLHARTARGHQIRLHDATEKARDAADPLTVTATPEEDAQRVASEVVIQTEQGHTVTLHDDPILATDRYVRVRSAGGHEFLLRDKPDADVHASLTTTAGHRVTLRDKPAGDAGAEVTTAGGLAVRLRDDTHTLTVIGETVVVAAQTIKLGSAGASKRVLLDGDTGQDSRGDTYTLTGTTTKIFGE